MYLFLVLHGLHWGLHRPDRGPPGRVYVQIEAGLHGQLGALRDGGDPGQTPDRGPGDRGIPAWTHVPILCGTGNATTVTHR